MFGLRRLLLTSMLLVCTCIAFRTVLRFHFGFSDKPKSLFSSREQICIKEKKCLLNCSFDANPQASISWLWENGTKVRTSDDSIKFRFGGNSSTLTLVRPGFNIDGIEIRCEANNSIGSSIRLFVKGVFPN